MKKSKNYISKKENNLSPMTLEIIKLINKNKNLFNPYFSLEKIIRDKYSIKLKFANIAKNIEFFISNNSSNICVTARYFDKQTNIPQIKKSLSDIDFLSEVNAPDKILKNKENNKYYCSECSEINENIRYYNSQEHLLFEHTVLPFIEWFNEKITLESKIYFWRHKNSMSSSFVLLNEKEIDEKKERNYSLLTMVMQK